MGWHNILISQPARLSVKNAQLLCQLEKDNLTIPLEDIASITIESHQIVITGGLLSALADHNIILVSCDKQHLPNAVMLPMAQHSRQLSALKLQVNTSKPLLKRLWQIIVAQKIINQAMVLEWQNTKNVNRLKRLAKAVNSGDSNNCESTAARLYFSSLFKNFKRHNNDLINSQLNYGYAIIRTAIARELTAFGLHAELGIHHCSELNAFNLADDLIEPFRPILDSWVVKHIMTIDEDKISSSELSKENRAQLIQILQLQTNIDNDCYTLQSAIRICVKSLISALKNKDYHKLNLPSILFPPQLKELN